MKTANDAQRRAARALLRAGIAATLLPLLSDLQKSHSLTCIILYGFVPGADPKGNDTSKPLFSEFPIFRATERSSESGITIARGAFDMRHEATRGHATLSDLSVLFMSQGPSSKASDASLQEAARDIRRRGWVPGASEPTLNPP